MSIKLRLARYGGKKHAFYRLVAADSRARRDGRFLEQIGTYDPNTAPAAVRLKADRIKHWIGLGAQPSETVAKLLKDHLTAPSAS